MCLRGVGRHPTHILSIIRSPFSALCIFVLPPPSSSPDPAEITGVGVSGAIVLEEKKGCFLASRDLGLGISSVTIQITV